MTAIGSIATVANSCLGFVCGYKTTDEHCHDTYEELLACQGRATPAQYQSAVDAIQSRKGTRGRHPRKATQDAADKALSA